MVASSASCSGVSTGKLRKRFASRVMYPCHSSSVAKIERALPSMMVFMSFCATVSCSAAGSGCEKDVHWWLMNQTRPIEGVHLNTLPSASMSSWLRMVFSSKKVSIFMTNIGNAWVNSKLWSLQGSHASVDGLSALPLAFVCHGAFAVRLLLASFSAQCLPWLSRVGAEVGFEPLEPLRPEPAVVNGGTPAWLGGSLSSALGATGAAVVQHAPILVASGGTRRYSVISQEEGRKEGRQGMARHELTILPPRRGVVSTDSHSPLSGSSRLKPVGCASVLVYLGN